MLAGGGALGAVQVGMLAALLEADVHADLVLGASAGAVNGTFFAFHPSASGVERLARFWTGLARADVFPIRPSAALRGLLGVRDGLVSQDAFEALLREAVGQRSLDGAEIECHVVAADVDHGEPVVISEGSALRALLASTAIPGVFAPVSWRGRPLFDGGVASNTPVRAAVDRGASEIVVLPTGCSRGFAPRGPLALTLHALNLLIARQLAFDLRAIEGAVDLRIVPPLCPQLTAAHDFSHAQELIERSHKQTAAWIASGGLERVGIPSGILPTAA